MTEMDWTEHRRKGGTKIRVINWMNMESLGPGFFQSLHCFNL